MRVIISGGHTRAMDALDWLRLDAIHATTAADRERAGLVAATTPVGPIECVYEGGAEGIDHYAHAWATSRGIPVITFPAAWGQFGKAAGPIRNGWMLRGEHPQLGQLPLPDLLIHFAGNRGTADMVAQATEAEEPLPAIDLGAPRVQRWGPSEISDLRAMSTHLISHTSAAIEDARRAAVRLVALAHGGLGVPVAQAHLFRSGGEQINLPPGSLYCGRQTSRSKLVLPPDGDGSILGNPAAYPDGLPDDQVAAAMDAYRAHLRDLFKRSAEARALIEHIGLGGTLLICWCHQSKPCHTTVIAEAALLVRAKAELVRAGLPAPPKVLMPRGAQPRASSARSTASAPSASQPSSARAAC